MSTIYPIKEVHNIPIRYTEELDSFQPVSNELFSSYFYIALDEFYTALSLKNGGFIVSDRTGVGSTFATKNIISEIQKRRIDNGLDVFTFITIDNQITDLCDSRSISLGEYISEIIEQVDRSHPERIVFFAESYIVGDKLAQLSPAMGFKSILEIADTDFKDIFVNPRTVNITKRMASGWIVGRSPFSYLQKNELAAVVTEMVNYGLQGSSYNITCSEVERLLGLMEEVLEENEEFKSLRDALNEGNMPGLEKSDLFPSGICANFIQLFTILTKTSTSEEYSAVDSFENKREYEKEILRQVSYFSSTWNIVIENNSVPNKNNEGITVIPLGPEMGNLTDEDLDKMAQELLSQLVVTGTKGASETKEEKETEHVKEFHELEKVSESIKKEVLCQDNVVDTIVSSFAVPAMGLRDETKPVRSIIAAGSTGVGKALHAKTPILTPYGYKTVGELQAGDTIFGGNGKPCKITAKYQPKTKDHYILSFSNGESIIACGDHLWTIVDNVGITSTVDTRSLSTDVHEHGEHVFVVAPDFINDNVAREEKIAHIVSLDKNMKSLVEINGFTRAVELITERYCAIVNAGIVFTGDNENEGDGVVTGGPETPLESSLTRSIVVGGDMPDWYYFMPLKDRLNASSIIIDKLENIIIKQSKRCTYVSININNCYHESIVRLFSTVGCVRIVDSVNSVDNEGNEILNFSVGDNVAILSVKLSNISLDKNSFKVSRYIEIVDVEQVDESLVVPGDFYCFTVDSMNSLFLCGETNIPTHNTKLAYSLAKNLYSEPVELIRIDMSEYGDRHEVARLVGAPPGYQGFKEGSVLTNAANKNPQAIILIDEVEKAHPDVWDIFLQVLDAGRLTDGMGKTADFSNNVFIFTTNLGVEERKKGNLGFGDKHKDNDNNNESTIQALKKSFRPEFLGRVDEIVVFNDITDGANLIVKQEISILRDKMKLKGYTIRRIPETIINHILSKSDFKKYGARDIQKIVRKEIAEKVAMEMLKGKNKKETINEHPTTEGKTNLKNVSLSIKDGLVIVKTK